MCENNLLLFICGRKIAVAINKPTVKTNQGLVYKKLIGATLDRLGDKWSRGFAACTVVVVVVIAAASAPLSVTSSSRSLRWSSFFHDGPRATRLVSKSRQKTGSGGRLSASGITCRGYAE